MSRITKTFDRLRRGPGDRHKQDRISLESPSASITSKGSSATGSKIIQQEQSKNSFPFTCPATHPEPTAAQSFWDEAYDALAKKMPDLVKEYDDLLAKEEQMANSAPSETTSSHLPVSHGLDTGPDRSPRQVQLDTVIQNGLRRMEDNKTTYTIAGHEFVLADQITKAAKFLDWSKDFIGSAVKNSSEASLVWAGVSLIIPLLTNPTTADEANRDGFAYVTSRMRYYVALELMVRRLGLSARVDAALISAANGHIVDLYHAILEFQLSSVLRFYQTRLKTYLRDIVPSRDWEKARLDIEKLEETVNKEVVQINELATREELERLNKTSDDMRTAMETILTTLDQQQQERLLAKQDKCLQRFCLTQDGSSATYVSYKDRVKSRVEGTCEWFLQHKNFRKWLLQESGPLLVSADPGCGKSVLARYLIDHKLADISATICYFFFKDQYQNTICQALCALIHQLFSHNRALIRHAMQLHSSMGATLVQSETSLWTILRDAVRDPEAGPVILIIDALDECADESELRSLITNLGTMCRDQQAAENKFKVLMTSRPYQHVVSEFYSYRASFDRFHIRGEEEFATISEEINSVIHHQVEQLAEKHQLSDKIKTFLNSKLIAIGHRTYLWVYLVFDYLDKGFNKKVKKTEGGIKAAIRTLPETVNQAYDRILIRSQEDGTIETVKKALSIVLAARRPLTLSEMNIAMGLIGQDRGQSIDDLDLEEDEDFKPRCLDLEEDEDFKPRFLDLEEDEVFMPRFRTLCGLFVNVHHGRIYFLHQTAREFLIRSSASTTVSSNLQWHHSISTRHAHSVLAEICMLYLDILNSTPMETFRRDDQYGALLEYSDEYWVDHFREADIERSSSMVDLASELCTPDLSSRSKWASIISMRYHLIPESSRNVLVASHLALTPVIKLLLERGANIEAKDSRGWTALMIVADYGHQSVTRLLLEYGARVEVKDDASRTALMHAARSDHEAVARMLLENRANTEARTSHGWTALTHAARYGHEAATRLLLEHGAKVEATDDKGWTALMHAARSGHEGVTRLLLESGADVDAEDNEGWTALKYASDTITELLLGNGAPVEAKDVKGSAAETGALGWLLNLFQK